MNSIGITSVKLLKFRQSLRNDCRNLTLVKMYLEAATKNKISKKD